jgi:hypothetical protein
VTDFMRASVATSRRFLAARIGLLRVSSVSIGWVTAQAGRRILLGKSWQI